MTPPRRGVLIGAGGVARLAHLPAYVHDESTALRLQIVGAVDTHPPTTPLDGLTMYPSLDAAKDLGPVDFVDICTPPSTHKALTLDALAHGLHVFCEKPVAVTRAAAQELSAAARAAQRVLFPCHQYRQNPAWVAMRRCIEEGTIGRWHLAEFNVYRLAADGGVAGAATGTPWRARQSESMGGILLDHGTHLLYLLVDVAGMPASVTAQMTTLGHRGYDVEDTAHVLVDYGDRAASFTLTWAARERENRIRFIGDRGSVEWTGGVVRVLPSDAPAVTTDFTAQLDKREYAGWMSRILGDFADAMDRGESAASLLEIEQVATLLEAAYRSASEGRRIVIA